MYTKGNILYFKPFYFPDGGSAKNKYFIVLDNDDEDTLIASLPTSQDHIPSSIEKKHGCIDKPDINFNCYFFEAHRSITENTWGFPLNTYLYGPQVAKFNRRNFESIYTLEDFDYEFVGRLIESEFNAIINCIKNSKSVSRKIRKLLGAKI